MSVRYEREMEIVRRVRRHGSLTVETLAAQLQVSESTIRRDLERLDGQGITRVHGGAVAPDVERPFDEVATNYAEVKARIALAAAQHVADGETVILDVGTTVRQLARSLRGRRVTVVTSSLAVLDELRDDPATTVIVTGGVLRKGYLSLTGHLASDVLDEIYADVAFLGTSGISRAGTVLDTTLEEVPIKRSILKSTRRSILLADHSKFPGCGTLQVCGVNELDMIVTDLGADPATLDRCTELGVEVHQV